MQEEKHSCSDIQDSNNNKYIKDLETKQKPTENDIINDLSKVNLMGIKVGSHKYKNDSNSVNDENNDKVKDNYVKYIEINPLGNVSHRSSLQRAIVFACTAIYSLLPLASLISLLILVVLLFTRFYYITLIYFAYVLWDRKTCNKGGQRVDFIYNSIFWQYLGAYFPIKLRISDKFKLDGSKNYILSYHPHGISAFGSVVTFATNGLGLSKLFPGITSRFMVHETSFLVPVMRETFALRGDCSVNSESIDYMLTRSGSGNLLTICVGGLAEADLSDMEVLKVMVAKRKGFVKKALIHGAHVIPCIAFGENSVFTKIDYPEKSFMYRFETSWHKLFGFKHPTYHGRSIISNNMKGVMPYKKPITVVMGDPIEVHRIENPSQEEIEKLHDVYIDGLKFLYETNRDLSSKYDKTMLIV